MRRPLSLALLACLALMLALALAASVLAAPQSERRVALVIGNGAYKAGPLKNPTNDARDMATALRELGFEVILRENAGLAQMEQAVDQFWVSLKKGGTGLFFFAGHGMQVKGVNYLVPVDADIQVEQDVKVRCLDVNLVLGRMENAGNPLNLVILDACRNNPFARAWRNAGQGLAKMDAPMGTLIAYATAPDSVAADGAGKNGVYTQHLLQRMRTPGLKVEDVLKQTRIGVIRDTDKRQIPWESSSLTGDFYFRPGAGAEAPKPLQQALASIPKQAPGAARREGSCRVVAYAPETAVLTGRLAVTGTMREGKKLQALLLNLDEPVMDARGGFGSLAGCGKAVEVYSSDPGLQTRLSGLLRNRKNVSVTVSGTLTEHHDPGRHFLPVSMDVKAITEVKAGSGDAPAAGAPQAAVSVGSPGQAWTDPVTGMEFVWVPGGCFQMGSNDGNLDERPTHKVCVSGFGMGKYEVTNEEYRRFKPNHDSKESWGNSLNGERQPVVNVSWEDAGAYAEWISNKGNGRFRLPTEAEWEYAARAGSKGVRFWGDNPDLACSFANVHDVSSRRVNRIDWPFHDCDDGYAATAPVGTFRPNAFGIFDMMGNAYEWCEDSYYEKFYSRSPRDNPVNTAQRFGHVSRGGSYLSPPERVRSAFRESHHATYQDTGFRLVRVP